MELYIQDLPPYSNVSNTRLELIEAISKVLHGKAFRELHVQAHEPLHNFDVLVRENFSRPFQSNSQHPHSRLPSSRFSATITFPTAVLAKRFDAYVSVNPVIIFDSFPVNFRQSSRQGRVIMPHPDLIKDLKQTLFKDHVSLLTELLEHEILERPFSISCLEFGRTLSTDLANPTFASEFSLLLPTGDSILTIDTSNNLLWIRWSLAASARSMVIRMKSIKRMEADQLSVTLWLDTPPTFEDIQITRQEERSQVTETRYRVPCPHTTEQHVFPFVSDRLRITFGTYAAYKEFCRRKTTVRLPKIIHLTRPTVEQQLYTPQNLAALEAFLVCFTIPVGFQIEALLSHALLDPIQIRNVCEALVGVDPDHAERALIHYNAILAQSQTQDFQHSDNEDDPESVTLTYLKRLTQSLESTLIDTRTPNPHLLSGDSFPCRTVSITPSRFILEGPVTEQSNSVLRMYRDTHNFLRISIREENGFTLRPDRDVDILRLLRTRYLDFLTKGLKLCGRKFEFLGYSSSALREHQAWFVCPFYKGDSLVTAASIRQRLGDFSKVIDIPARYMARVAQAFTSTRQSLTLLPSQIVRIDDVERNGSCFTDGVGTISLELARQVDEVLTARLPSRQRRHHAKSSCFQIRLGGFKGMLSVDPTLTQACVCVRPSMDKFVSPDSLTLDIAGVFTRPLPAYLNRPMIKVLEDLGIHEQVFLTLQREIVRKVEHSRTNLRRAGELMDQLSMARTSGMPSLLRQLGTLIGDEGNPQSDFIEECYDLMIMQCFRDLKYRARIPLDASYTLVGVADEDRVLAPNFVYACIQYPGKAPFYLEGPITISRSPCLHPGDVRVVTGIGKLDPERAPRLNALRNCVVFSVAGMRSLPSCLGGGDLDGDLYTLITLPELIPSTAKLLPPASYSAPEMKRLGRPCTIEDGAVFFLDYISSDLVGVIASRHLHIADQAEQGTRDDLCLELVALHSDAVDYPKTGVPVAIDQLPRAPNRMKPDFMCPEHHERREGDDYYESQKVLGKLFRQIPAEKIDIFHHNAHPGGPPVTAPATAGRFRRNKGQLFGKLDPSDVISKAVRRAMRRTLAQNAQPDSKLMGQFKEIMKSYAEELMQICKLNTLSSKLDRHLAETEAFLVVLTDTTVDKRLKKHTLERLDIETGTLFERIRLAILDDGEGALYDSEIVLLDADEDDPQRIERDRQINRAYTAWYVSTQAPDQTFGAHSFGLLALDLLLARL
ncbi:RNA dependent RNA polymerase-domain-containing protein [Melampsora americana]|nr:RNA dependent RNA polymerase-domain-containing protein [Melampsora americana]